MRQAGEVNYTNTHQVQPQHELLSGAIITINVLLRVGVERELLSLGRAATWSKFYLSAKSNTHQLEAFACTTNFRYALDKLDGAELGGRRIRIFEEGKGGGGEFHAMIIGTALAEADKADAFILGCGGDNDLLSINKKLEYH